MVRRKEDYDFRDIPMKFLNYRWEAPQFGDHHFIPKLTLWEKKPSKEILELRESIKVKGLERPLIVKQADYSDLFDKSCYYVIIGNRRLCALRNMGFSGTVNCIIATEADKWTDDTMARKIFEI
jgi:ParB-like chromosome segregation protein Spo0J